MLNQFINARVCKNEITYDKVCTTDNGKEHDSNSRTLETSDFSLGSMITVR